MDQLHDDSVTLVSVCAFFIAICTVVVSLRMYVRWYMSASGIDDYLFVLGLILWIISTAFVIPACWSGLGAHVYQYTPAQGVQAQMYFFLFQHFYVWANIPIKASLCLTIIRIASDIRWIRWTLHTIICLLVIASLITNIYLLTDCKPFVANWDKTVAGAQCRPAEGTVALGYAYSAINIIIDWTVALLPIFLLWRIQMRWAQKLPVMVVLALGVFASTATLVRLRTLTNFTNVSDYLFGLGPIVLWTVTELALALIAGSLIAYRPLLRRFFGSTQGSSTEQHPTDDVYLRSIRTAKSRCDRTGSSTGQLSPIEPDHELSDHEIGVACTGDRNESQQSIIVAEPVSIHQKS